MTRKSKKEVNTVTEIKYNEPNNNVVGEKVIHVASKKDLDAIFDSINRVQCERFLAIPTEVTKRVSGEAAILYGYMLGYKGYYGSNVKLAEDLGCSTRTIMRLLNELIDKECIKVVYWNKTTRMIYPLYAIPYILNVESKPNNKSIEDTNGGFEEL